MPATISVNFATQAEVEGTTPPTNKSISAKVLKDVLGGGSVTGGYVTLGGAQTITGAKTFSASIVANGGINVANNQTYKLGGVDRLYGTTQDSYVNARVLQNISGSLQDGMWINYNSTGAAAADIRFFANGTTERMRIDAQNGRVGINTTTPTDALDVNGRVACNSVTVGGRTANIGKVTLEAGNATNPGYIAWFRPDGTTRIAYQGWGAPGGNTHLSLNLENSANFKVFNGQMIVHPPGYANDTILKPPSWGGGVTTFDVYATGSVGSGPSNGEPFAYMSSNGNIGLRAPATASAASQILVVTANPASVTRTIETRTPAQLLSDMGGQTTLGFTPVQQGGGTGQGNNKVYIGWTGSTINLQVDSTNFGGTWPMNITGNAATVTNGVYTTGNQTIAGIKTFSGDVRVDSFGVGTAASGTTGEIRATNNITAYYSDGRLKDFLGKIPQALEKVQALNGYYFKENEKAKTLGYNNDKIQVGVNAQEVEKVLPEIVTLAPIDTEVNENGEEVSKSGENIKTVYYDKLVPLLIEAIKELNDKVKNLEAKLNS